MERDPAKLELPTVVFGAADVRRLLRELEDLDDYLIQAAAREGGKPTSVPRASRSLDAVASNNGLNLLQADDRQKINSFLNDIYKHAPVIHISFASDPSTTFTAKIVAWLRSNVHPHALLHVGLQPAITAGCVVRTANKSFDFSLRHYLIDQRSKLVEALIDGVKK